MKAAVPQRLDRRRVLRPLTSAGLALTLCAAAATTSHAQPQREDVQFWSTVTLTASSTHWDFRSDVNFGLTDDASRAGRLLLRGVLSYHITKKLSAGGGYTYFSINDGIGSRFKEHRLVEEISYRSSQHSDHARLTLRMRVEQRIPEKGDQVATRLRQFTRIDLPIRSDGLKTIAWNEMFYSVNATNWSGRSGFSTMFNFVGVGVPLRPGLSAELGHLNQTNFRPGRNGVRHIAQATLLVTL
jgi:hypothetical protein